MPSQEPRRHVDVLLETIPVKDRTVIDVGCGDGKLVRRLAQSGAKATGVEISPAKVTRAKSNDPDGSGAYVEGRGEALPFANASLEGVIFFNSLHHVPEGLMSPALAEAERILKVGGWLYVAEPIADGPNFRVSALVDDETHVRALAQTALDGRP
ncbi:MAG: class I SAM-dependent methyltransferase, partial [Rhodospirillales bacterium]